MIIFCEECGSRNDVDPKAYEDEVAPARCAYCNDILNKATAKKIKVRQDESLDRVIPALREEEGDQALVEASPAEPVGGIVEPVVFSTAAPEILDPSDFHRNLEIGEL